MTHGIKSLAQELHKHGRYGDTMVAHINPQEAAILKAMGGSGTINPVTGLPEFGWNPVKTITNAVKGIVQPVYNATIKNIPGVDQGLVGLDKAVGSAIPGGWGTLGTVAASFIPGMQPLGMAGIGALNGSGMLRKDGKFNLQGALMGGAMAYGMSNLAAGLQSAGSSIPDADIAAANAAPDAISALNTSQAWTGPAAEAATNAAAQTAGTGAANAANAVNPDVYSGLAGTQGAITPPVAAAPSGLEQLAQGYGENASAAGRGIANLSGLGPTTSEAARAAFTGSGATLQNTALPIVAGGTGLAAAEQQAQDLKNQQAINSANQADYNSQMAKVNAAKARAAADMEQYPYQFAMGGMIPNPPDDQTGMPTQTPMRNFEQGGMMGYAEGGMAGGRFLSGGGDGLSDDIPAVIGDKQPAKLADGEFVISSDVVSNLGNGSSKAGAKKLYEMMDRVRQQAHGSKKQICKVNANKALPA
jgi:hypothetical protein